MPAPSDPVKYARWLRKNREAQLKVNVLRKEAGIPHPNKGRPLSEEHRRRLSEAHKGQKAWNKGKVGLYTASTETRRKQSESIKKAWARKSSEEKRAIGLKREYDKRRRKKAADLVAFGNRPTTRRAFLIKRDGSFCKGCGEDLPEKVLEVDKIIPKGGYTPDNCQLLCAQCNRRKGNRPMDWLIEENIRLGVLPSPKNKA